MPTPTEIVFKRTCPCCNGTGTVVAVIPDVPLIISAQPSAAITLLRQAEAAIGHSCSIEDGCVVFKSHFEWDPNIETAHEVAMAIKRAYDKQLAACGLRTIDAGNDWYSLWGKIVPAE